MAVMNMEELLTDLQDRMVTQERRIRLDNDGIMPLGGLMLWPTADIPDRFMIADGRTLSRTDYRELFAVLGTKFGTGDGSTTFGIPDMRGRVPVGLASDQGEFDTLNEVGGDKYIALTQSQMPRHTHGGSTGTNGGHTHSGTTATNGGHTHSGTTGDAGWHGHTGTTDWEGDHSHSGGTSTNGNHSHGGGTSSGGYHSHSGVANIAFGSGGGSGIGQVVANNGSQNNRWSIEVYGGGEHSHSIGTDTQGDHSHSFGTNGSGGHDHGLNINNSGTHSHGFGTSQNGDHSHNFGTSQNGDHSHGFTTDGAGGNQSGNTDGHPNMQPYRVMHFVIRVK